MEALSDARAVVRETLLDASGLVRAVASGRQRNTEVPFRRVEMRYVDLKAGRRLQLTSYDDTQSHTRNVELGRPAEEAIDEMLAQPFANWHVQSSAETLQLRITKRGRPLLHRGAATGSGEPDRSHDRVKSRRLDESDQIFRLLGIAADDGRIRPSRLAKFKQVQDFLAALDPVTDRLSEPVRMVDLGCGNAYLTFAAFRYLTVVKGLSVEATGIDVKAQARMHNAEIAAQLGVTDRLQFEESTIQAAAVSETPDLVLALHACDTATDEALARAVQWQAPVILAAPCCHHDIQRQLSAESVPDAYKLVTRHGILRERMADVLTDALRATILRMVGYRVEVIEFVDSQHTPRNVLIRAVRTSAPVAPETVDAYWSLITDWGVQPALATLLAGDHPELGPTDVDELD
ncbi:MAG: SAM-dependent methyltransferase [Nocardioidaceae bacterium]|nr:SAM-dependent methyltransferase [Nocardioidaceae bacterium]